MRAAEAGVDRYAHAAMIADRTLVLALTVAAVVLLVVATATGNALVGWAAIVLFLAALVAYWRWRRGRRMF